MTGSPVKPVKRNLKTKYSLKDLEKRLNPLKQ